MRLYYYKINIVNAINGKNIALIAPNKKEALNFAKEFEGLTIGDRDGCCTGSKASLSIEEIMKQQSNILKQLLREGKVRIEKWILV